MPLPAEKRHQNQKSLGPQSRVLALEALQLLIEPKKTEMTLVLAQMGHWFWDAKRREQVVALLDGIIGTTLTQKDIACVMGVTEMTVVRYKRRREEHPDDLHPRIGRPSDVRDVFPDVEAFIANEIQEGRSVTLSILVDFVLTKLRVSVKRRTVREFLESHGYSLVSAVPTEDLRVNVDRVKLVDFFNNTLPAALNGVEPSLVFNVDEMGSERYADRKRINVLVPSASEHRDGMVVGIPRTSYRCTLIACISLDGECLKPAIITKNKTVTSALFENGYDTNRVKLYHTKNSFITGEVFWRWLNDIFLPHVEERREVLRRQRGNFNERAVLIMDGCTCHKLTPFLTLLASKNVTPVFLVPHSSHLTQPLDLGIFGRLKSIIRNEATYTIPVHEMVVAADAEENGEDVPQQTRQQAPRPPRGMVLAGCIEAILEAFENATSRRKVVNSFSQAGIAYKIPDPRHPDIWVTYVDPGLARAVREFGLFTDRHPIDRPERGPVSIADLNLNSESWSANGVVTNPDSVLFGGIVAGLAQGPDTAQQAPSRSENLRSSPASLQDLQLVFLCLFLVVPLIHCFNSSSFIFIIPCLVFPFNLLFLRLVSS